MGVEIHVIKRNGKHEFRCGNNISDSYTLSSRVEEPFDRMEDAVAYMVDWQARNQYGVFDDLSHPKASQYRDPDTRESATKGWTEYLGRVLKGEEKWAPFHDLDAYVKTVQRVTDPNVARTDFLLGDKEVGILREVGGYLMRERTIPVNERDPQENFRLDLFNVTIDKLTDCEEHSTAKPHPKLKPAEVTALNDAHSYVGWLKTTHYRRE